MDSYIRMLWHYIADNLIKFDEDCDHPVLNLLYCHYTEDHGMLLWSNKYSEQIY